MSTATENTIGGLAKMVRATPNSDRQILWGEFYLLVRLWLIAFLKSKGVPTDDCEDAVHDVFIKIMTSMDRVIELDALKMYMIRIGQTVASRYRRPFHLGLDEARQIAAADDTWNFELAEALKHLPVHYQEVLKALYTLGQSREEAAASLDCSPNHVHKIQQKALSRIRRELCPQLIANVFFIDHAQKKYTAKEVLPTGDYQIGITVSNNRDVDMRVDTEITVDANCHVIGFHIAATKKLDFIISGKWVCAQGEHGLKVKTKVNGSASPMTQTLKVMAA